MEINIIIQGKDDPPRLTDLPKPLIDCTENSSMTVALIQGGMQSGEPAVIIVSSDEHGSVCLQTSLDKYLMAGATMVEAAKTLWNWTPPEGYATLMPLDKESRKLLLENIQKELEEWDKVETEEWRDIE